MTFKYAAHTRNGVIRAEIDAENIHEARKRLHLRYGVSRPGCGKAHFITLWPAETGQGAAVDTLAAMLGVGQ